MRFALVTVSSVDDSKAILGQKLGVVTQFVIRETANISKFVDIIGNVSQVHVNIQKQIDREIALTMPNALREVRSAAIQSSAKTLTFAMQYQQFEELIVKFAADYENSDNKRVEEILETMRNVQNEMSLQLDEHKRLTISFQKYINMEVVDEGKLAKEQLETPKTDENVTRITESDTALHMDEFFFVDGHATAEEVKDQPETVEEVNSKLAKKYFKPVLVQLKERIEVIGEDMKAREKKVLKAKGIEIAEDPEPAKVDSEDSGSDDELERQRKFKKNQEKFQSDRDFLESKQPISLFGAFHLPSPALNEDVLE